MIVDLFAGPGGWDEALTALGRDDVVGLEWDAAACATAKAAGHARIRCDVAAYPTEPFAGVEGVIASPPCQAWSMAGSRKGESDRANCHFLADRMAAGDDSTDWTEWEDERSPLVVPAGPVGSGPAAAVGGARGGPRCCVPVGALRPDLPWLGVLGVDRRPEQRRLRRPADKDASHPHGVPRRSGAATSTDSRP